MDVELPIECRSKLIKFWLDNLSLYKYNANSTNPNIVQDFLPLEENVNQKNLREFIFLQQEFELSSYDEDELIEKIQKNGIEALKKYSTKDLTRYQIHNNNIIRLIVKGIITKIDLLEFIKKFPDAAAVMLSQRTTEEQEFLPSELAVLFGYCKKRCQLSELNTHNTETCYFKQFYDLLVQLQVEQEIKFDVICMFAIESGDTCALSLLLDNEQNRQKFVQLSLHTFSVINTTSFNYLLLIFEKYDELDSFLYSYDKNGVIPLHAAAFIGNIKVLKTIFAIQSVFSQQTEDGMTILDCVLCSKNPVTLHYVIEYLKGEGLLKHFLFHKSNGKANAILYPIFRDDVNSFRVLIREVPIAMLQQEWSAGLNAVLICAYQENQEFFQQCLTVLDRQQQRLIAREIRRRLRGEENSEVISPLELSLKIVQKSIRTYHFEMHYLVTLMQFALLALVAACPFLIFYGDSYKFFQLIFSECFSAAAITTKTVLYMLLGHYRYRQRSCIQITQCDYRELDGVRFCPECSKCVPAHVYHCQLCGQCYPVGAYHYVSLRYCVCQRHIVALIADHMISLVLYIEFLLFIGIRTERHSVWQQGLQIVMGCLSLTAIILYTYSLNKILEFQHTFLKSKKLQVVK